ncbi:MAG: cytochrome ubiquinol oxidase subunit I, partial [Chthoniobacterales bacterium]
VLGAWMAGAFLVVSISAYYVLRGRHLEFARASLKVGLAFATAATLLQMVSGDSTAKGVVKNQPVKLAAIEGLYKTEPSAPLVLFGWVDAKTETVHGPAIPGLLSFLSYYDFNKPVAGLNDLPPDEFLLRHHPGASAAELPTLRKDYWPNVPLVFQTYHLMVGVGSALLALILVACFYWWRGWLFDTSRRSTRWLLAALVLSVLGPQIANQAGWFTAEAGRQPWIVWELLRTSDAVSKVVTANQIIASMILFTLVYMLLFVMFIFLLTRKIQHGPDHGEESHEMPESWKAVLRSDDQESRA